MVFLSGPRQVGKSWPARRIDSGSVSSVYLNYDNRERREVIERYGRQGDTDPLVLDELNQIVADLPLESDRGGLTIRGAEEWLTNLEG